MFWWLVLRWIVGSVLIFDAALLCLMIYAGRENFRQSERPALRIIANGDRR